MTDRTVSLIILKGTDMRGVHRYIYWKIGHPPQGEVGYQVISPRGKRKKKEKWRNMKRRKKNGTDSGKKSRIKARPGSLGKKGAHKNNE